MEKIKAAVIGMGHAGCDFHLPGLSTFNDLELCVCDIDEERLKTAGDRFGVSPEKRYTDYREMFRREDPEAVFVLMAQYTGLTENDSGEIVKSTRSREAYFRIVNEALEQKRNVLVEKPLAMTPAEALPLVKAAEKAGVVTMVSENRRFNPLVQYCLKKVLERGPVLNVNCSFYKGVPSSRRKVCLKDGREAWLDDRHVDWLTGDMIHALYLTRYLAGGEIIDFASTQANISGDYGPTAFFALARFDSGATGIFSSNVRAGARREVWQMHGMGISAYIETIGGGPSQHANMKASIYTGNDIENPEVVCDYELAGDSDYRKCRGFTAADRYFIDCVKSGRQPHCNFADGYKTVCYCEKILKGTLMTVK